MAYYIKVTPEVAASLNLTDIRNKTADGNYLLWQADVAGRPGKTIAERAASVGGVCLSPADAKKEIDGTIIAPATVSTPSMI